MARKWFGPPREPRRMPIPNGDFVQRHPTRYGWHDDVRNLIDRLFKNFNGISINTYVDHPEGWSKKLDYNTSVRSFDVWRNKGRGVDINQKVGDQVVDFVFDNQGKIQGKYYVSWCIWKGEIWKRSTKEWRKWPDDGTGPHFDHVHFTMMPRRFRP